jgi:hypothetical protein
MTLRIKLVAAISFLSLPVSLLRAGTVYKFGRRGYAR